MHYLLPKPALGYMLLLQLQGQIELIQAKIIYAYVYVLSNCVTVRMQVEFFKLHYSVSLVLQLTGRFET